MTLPKPNPEPSRSWPMTSDAWSALLAEIAQLDIDLAAAPPVGVIRLPFVDPARRRRILVALRDGAVVDDSAGAVAIGRAVTIREADGAVERYSVVLPGDGDPRQGWVSADSPLGAAVLGALPGDRVRVTAPAGVREVEVLAVD
jgi:hypothetical protein